MISKSAAQPVSSLVSRRSTLGRLEVGMALASQRVRERGRDRDPRGAPARKVERSFERLCPDEQDQEKHHLGRRVRLGLARPRRRHAHGPTSSPSRRSRRRACRRPPAHRRQRRPAAAAAGTPQPERRPRRRHRRGADLAVDRAVDHRPARRSSCRRPNTRWARSATSMSTVSAAASSNGRTTCPRGLFPAITPRSAI